MKIAIIFGPFLPIPPSNLAGAVEHVWYGLGSEFSKLGISVSFYSTIPKEKDYSQEIKDSIIKNKLRGFTRSKNIWINILKDFFYSLKVVFRLKEDDVVICNTFWLQLFLSISPLYKGKIIVPVQRVPKGQIRLYKFTSLLVAVSSEIKRRISIECPDLSKKTITVVNPVDVNTFVPKFEIRETSPKIILYTGRIHPEKGILVLINAFKLLYSEFQDIKLQFVGPYKSELGGGGEAYLESLKIESVDLPIEFLGSATDRMDLAKRLQTASFYVYPTLAEEGEACPVAPMEAMACGLVPIVSDISQFGDYIEGGVSGIIFHHRDKNPALNLSQAIRKLLIDPEFEKQLSKNALESIRRFSYINVAKTYIEIFQSINSI